MMVANDSSANLMFLAGEADVLDRLRGEELHRDLDLLYRFRIAGELEHFHAVAQRLRKSCAGRSRCR